MINALLQSGTFDPTTYGVHDEMLATADKAWQFCLDFQRQNGRAPGRELFHRSFPEIESVADVPAQWAADKLRTAYWERSMRKQLHGAIAAINDKDWDMAQHLVAEAARPAARARPKGMDALDPSSVDDAAVKIAIPVPYAELQKATLGLGLGELWYFGARLGQGKSWYLPIFAWCAAQYGFDVGILTAEMPKRQWIHRLHVVAAKDAKHVRRLKDPDAKVRAKALDELEKPPGRIEVFDPSDIEMGVRSVRLLAQEHQMLVLDHVGLFRDHKGVRSIDDWRAAASISNDNKEIALSASIAILGGAQINREGETAHHKPPKVSQMSQTDALGQDADVAILGRRMGERAMALETGKNRSGPNVRWYTNFDPKAGNFAEIGKTDALQIQIEDAERLADV
jgi:replicative DNA helicase